MSFAKGAARRLRLDSLILGRPCRQGTTVFPPSSRASLSWTDSLRHQQVVKRRNGSNHILPCGTLAPPGAKRAVCPQFLGDVATAGPRFAGLLRATDMSRIMAQARRGREAGSSSSGESR